MLGGSIIEKEVKPFEDDDGGCGWDRDVVVHGIFDCVGEGGGVDCSVVVVLIALLFNDIPFYRFAGIYCCKCSFIIHHFCRSHPLSLGTILLITNTISDYTDRFPQPLHQLQIPFAIKREWCSSAENREFGIRHCG